MTVEISADHNGQTISIAAGDTVELRLAENASSGYRWAVDLLDETHVKLDDDGFLRGDAVGSGGKAYWRLRGTTPGHTTIRLKRWRAFEGDRSVVERFAVTLQITA